jgi:hypothetical protein
MTVMMLVTVLIGIATAASIGLTQRRIPSRGTVYVKVLGVEVYWDLECMSMVTEIDWGVLEPSDVATKTLYIKNTGNAFITLSLTTENWTPVEAGTYITVTWDVEGSTLDVDAIMAFSITLSVSTEISGISDFSVDIAITGGG